MMVIPRQLYKKTIKLFWLVLLLSCGGLGQEANPARHFECILDAYIESLSIDSSQCIVVSQAAGLTDSTDIITIFSHQKDRFDYPGIMMSEYRGLPIYFEYMIMNDSNKYLPDFSHMEKALPNKLKWSKVSNANRYIDSDEESGNPEEFEQIHFIYQPSIKCIREVVIDRNGFEQKIRAASGKCPIFCSR